MKMLGLLATAMAALVFVFTLGTVSSGASARPGGGTKAAKAEAFCVVQIGKDATDTSDIRAVAKSQLKTLEKTIKDEDTQNKKAYDDAKKNASKSKSKSKSKADSGDPDAPPANVGQHTVDLSQPPPVKRKFILLKECKSKEDADELVEKYRRDGVPDKKKSAAS